MAPAAVHIVATLGIAVAESTVDKYRVRPSRPPSPTWRTFLATHATELVSLDFFTVATVRFEILYDLIILAMTDAACGISTSPGAPHRRVDGPAGGGGVSLGHGTPLSPA